MINFIIPYHAADAARAKTNAAAISALYPSAKIALVADMPPLKSPQFGGQWTERWMKVATGDVIIKLDPDARLQKTFAVPKGDVFGQVATDGIYPVSGVIYGAAIGFTQTAIQKILTSDLLRDPKYTTAPYQYKTSSGRLVSLQDPIVSDIIARLGLKFAPWPGLYLGMSWRKVPRNIQHKRRTYTVFHPVR